MQIHRLDLDRPRLTRSRRVQACQQCRESRIKCDHKKPSCGACTTSSRVCVYRDSLRNRSHDVSQTVSASRTARSPKPQATTKTIHGDRGNSANTTHGSRHTLEVSWLCALNPDPQELPIHMFAEATSATASSLLQRPGGERFSSSQYERLFSPPNTDGLMELYQKCCHVWFPVVSPSEMKAALATCRDVDMRDLASAALITTICYIASKAARASGEIVPSLLACEEWQAVARILLELSGYPSKPSLHNIRAAFLLATGDMTETHSHLSVAPLSVLVRAAHMLGLHRDPSAYTSRSGDPELRRITWWAVHSLEICYSLAHGLPPITRAGSFDVQLFSPGFARQHPLFATIVRVNSALGAILEDVYGIREPTLRTLESLIAEVDKICVEEAAPLPDPKQSTSLERFAVVSRRVCCWKLKFVLHQPYLRSKLWPTNSRSKALDACEQYINDFLIGASDPLLAQYRWVFDHFNVFHPCAIILRDLIQHAGSLEAQSLKSIIVSCFENFFVETDPNWGKLQVLRDQAWHANSWDFPSDEVYPLTDFAPWSFLCDPVFMMDNQNYE